MDKEARVGVAREVDEEAEVEAGTGDAVIVLARFRAGEVRARQGRERGAGRADGDLVHAGEADVDAGGGGEHHFGQPGEETSSPAQTALEDGVPRVLFLRYSSIEIIMNNIIEIISL